MSDSVFLTNGNGALTGLVDVNYSGELIIPEYVAGEKITAIGDDAFSWCSDLTSITIPNGVTSIGNAAFLGCSSLTSITIPNSVTNISNDAFSSCSRLTSITIPNGVTNINNRTFSNCSSLTSITIPNSVTSIGSEAFNNCSSLTFITIPNSVISIGIGAFSGCFNLMSIIVPDSVTSIGDYAFSGCRNLTSITIPDSVASIGDRAFFECYSLTSIYVPDPNSISAAVSSYDWTTTGSTITFAQDPAYIDYLVKSGTLSNLADKIRVLSGTEDAMTPAEMVNALDNVSLGVELPELTNPASASDIAYGKEAIDADGNAVKGTVTVVDSEYYMNDPVLYKSGSYIAAERLLDEDILVRSGSSIVVQSPASNFGDATADQVASGATFTSKAGLNITGTGEMASELADELSTQDSLISQIATALEGKTAGSGGSGGTGNIISYSLSGTLNNGVVYGDLPSGYDKLLFIDKFIGGNLIFTNAGCYYGVFPIMNGDSYFYADQMNSSGGLIKASEAFYVGDQAFNWILDSTANTTLTTYSLTLFFMV